MRTFQIQYLFQQLQLTLFFPLSQILTGSFDKTAKMWDIYTGKCLSTQVSNSPINSVKISDGKQNVISSYNIDLINIKTTSNNVASKISMFREHQSTSTISECGSIIAIAQFSGLIQIIDANTFDIIDTFQTFEQDSLSSTYIENIQLTKDLKEVVVSTYYCIYIYDYHHSNLITTIDNPSHVTAIDIQQSKTDEISIIVGDEYGIIREQNKEGEMTQLQHYHFASITSLSVNEEFMVAGSKDGTASIQSLKEKKLIDHFTIHKSKFSPITSVKLSKQKEFCVLGNAEGEVSIQLIRSQKIIKTYDGHNDEISSIDIKIGDIRLKK